MEVDGEIDTCASTVADLICAGAGWIHRRKETIRFLDRQTIRRQISVDFVVDGLPVRKHDVVEAPILFLPKRPEWLMGFDFVDETNTSLSLPNRVDNAKASAEGLSAIARRTVPEIDLADQAVRDTLDSLLEQIALADMASADWLAAEFRAFTPAVHLAAAHRKKVADLQRKLCASPTFSWALGTFASSSVVIARVPSQGPRHRIVKLAYLEPVNDFDAPTGLAYESALGWAEYPLVVDIYFAGAGTYHVEVDAPPGTQIVAAGVGVEDAARGELQRRAVLEDWPTRVHLYMPDAERFRDGVCAVRLSVQRPGFVTGAFYSAVLVAATVVACTALAGQLLDAGADAAVALLLGLPGLIATYVAQPGQHALTTRLLYGARRMLGWSALSAYAATFVFVAVASSDDTLLLRLLWAPLIARALWSVVALWRTWQKSTPPSHQARLIRRLRAAWEGFTRSR